jgi:filamentous hemagglutinin
MRALAGVNVAAAVHEVSSLEKIHHASASVGFKQSKTQMDYEVREESAKGAVLSAGKELNIASRGNDMTVQGAELEGKTGVNLMAAGELQLLAAKNTGQAKDSNRSQSQSLGLSADIMGGVSVTGSLSQGSGHSESEDIHWANTQVKSEGTITMLWRILMQRILFLA